MQIFPITKQFVQGPDFIGLSPEKLEEQLDFASANNVDGFTITHNWKKQPFSDLSFLPAETVRGLSIAFEAVQDLSLINSFHQLEVMYNGWMSYPHMDIHLDNFPNMRVLQINWNKHYKSFDKLTNVIRLNLWKYKPKSRDLKELQNWNKLVYATFTQPSLDTLDGIESLNHLKELDLRNTSTLNRFFSDKRQTQLSLEKLEFELCKNFDIGSIPPIETLKFLRFTQIGKQSTLRILLSRFPNLETLIFTRSELEDGDLDYLLDHPSLKKVIIDHKKHYSLKEKEIQKLLNEKKNADIR